MMAVTSGIQDLSVIGMSGLINATSPGKASTWGLESFQRPGIDELTHQQLGLPVKQ